MGGAYQYQSLDPHSKKPSSSKTHGCFLSKPVCAWLAGGFLSLALLHLLCCSPAGNQRAAFSPLLTYINNTYSFVSSAPGGGKSCDYSDGQWVRAPGHARRYNATQCNVKESQDCLRNGRPDTGYLDWRWQPAAPGCALPAFNARAFLSAVRGKHVAIIGDSMARNQAQSLVCLLSAASPSRLLHRDAGRRHRHNFWRYAFPAYGVKVSFYWSPFLARATGKAEDENAPLDSHVHLDQPGDRWAADADTIDVAVLAAGHWLLNGAIYYNGSQVIGAHNAPEELHYPGIGYAWPLRMAYRTAVERLSSDGRARTVVLATFSPAHFDGKPFDSPTACTKMEPYKEGEKEVNWFGKEVRDIVYGEAAVAAKQAATAGGATRIEVLDVTKLATMRPDGHPGVYMNRDPFKDGVPDKIYSDCLHFCLPGPVDTFNDILLQILRKRR